MADSSEVKLHFLDYWRVVRVRAGLVLLAFFLVVISAGVATYFAPRKFKSSVFMELKAAAQTVNVFGGEGTSGRASPFFGPTQYEIIQRKEILYPVVDKLDLTRKWSETGTPLTQMQAYGLLRKLLEVKQVRNTEILELTAESEDPVEAAEVVNAVAAVYQDKIKELEMGRTDLGLSELESNVVEQEAKVERLFSEVSELGGNLRQHDIIDLNLSQPGDLQDPSRDILLTKEREVNEAKAKLAGLQSRLQQVDQLDRAELLNALTLISIPDPTVQKILPLYQDAVAAEAGMLNSGLGEKHPDVVALRAQMAVYQEQLAAADTAIRSSLQSEIRVSQTQLAALEEQLEEARNRQQAAREVSSEYIQKKELWLQAKAQLQAMRVSLQTQRAEQEIPRMPAIIWEAAEPATGPSSPNVMLNMILAVVLGLIVGIGLAFFIEYLDTSVKTLEEVETYLGVPVLAVVPSGIGLVSEMGAESPDAEAYRILRTNIEFNRKTPTANTMAVVSGGVGEGKSTTFHNLAHIFAQGGYSTVLIDADLRRPSQHRLFGMDNEVGLSTYLMSQIPIDDIIQESPQPNLSVITSGASSVQAIGFLNSQRMTDFIMMLKNRFDIVLIDSPPILGVSDASVVVSEADCTVIVVQHRRFPRSMLQRVKQSIVNVGGQIVGVVLNNVDVRSDAAYGYYTSYYDYYSGQDPKKKRRKAGQKGKPGEKPQPVKTADRKGTNPDEF